MFNLKVHFLSFLLLILSHSSHSEDYCCEFQDESLCNCINQGPVYWSWSGAIQPDLTGITDFDNGEPGEYEWIQSQGNAALITPTVTIDNLDEISIEIYRHSTSTSTEIVFNFFRTDPSPYTVLLDDERRLSGWQYITLLCEEGGTIQCCVTYPCSGWLQIKATLATTSDLVAFRNILINQCPPVPSTTTVSTTEMPTTTNAPTEAPVYSRVFCNRFESTSTDWTLEDWEYSVVSQPDFEDIPFPSHEGNYAWANNTISGKIISPGVQLMFNDEYSLEYYVYSSEHDFDNSLLIYFNDIDADQFYPLEIMQSSENWTSFVGRCGLSTPCCAEYPCNGQFIFEGSYGSGEVFIAVDNLQLNQGCVDVATCCDFDVDDICGMTIEDETDESTWIWSGDEAPILHVPLASGDFMFWEIVNKTTNSVQSTLKSDLLIAYPNSTINARYFISSGDKSAELDIRYHRQADDEIIPLDYLTLSLPTWFSYSVPCLGPHGACCKSLDGCAGWIEFVALSDGEGNTIFAVDDLEVDSQCTPV